MEEVEVEAAAEIVAAEAAEDEAVAEPLTSPIKPMKSPKRRIFST